MPGSAALSAYCGAAAVRKKCTAGHAFFLPSIWPAPERGALAGQAQLLTPLKKLRSVLSSLVKKLLTAPLRPEFWC